MAFSDPDLNPQPTPAQMRTVADGAAAAMMLPALELEIAKELSNIQTRTLMALRDGKLTPEGALEAWREIAAATRLLKNFKVRVTMGQQTADDLGPALDLQR